MKKSMLRAGRSSASKIVSVYNQMFFKTLCVSLLMLSAMPSLAAGEGDGAQVQGGGAKTSFLDNLMINLDFGAGVKQGGRTLSSFGAEVGCRVLPRLYPFVGVEGMLALYDKDSGNRYLRTSNLCGGLGYTFFRQGILSADIYGKVGASVGNVDWKNVTYDARVVFRIRPCRLGMNVGLGFRHISSRTTVIKGGNMFFGTIGFGI